MQKFLAKRKSSGGCGFCSCPVCGASVPVATLNIHLDTVCLRPKPATTAPTTHGSHAAHVQGTSPDQQASQAAPNTGTGQRGIRQQTATGAAGNVLAPAQRQTPGHQTSQALEGPKVLLPEPHGIPACLLQQPGSQTQSTQAAFAASPVCIDLTSVQPLTCPAIAATPQGMSLPSQPLSSASAQSDSSGLVLWQQEPQSLHPGHATAVDNGAPGVQGTPQPAVSGSALPTSPPRGGPGGHQPSVGGTQPLAAQAGEDAQHSAEHSVGHEGRAASTPSPAKRRRLLDAVRLHVGDPRQQTSAPQQPRPWPACPQDVSPQHTTTASLQPQHTTTASLQPQHTTTASLQPQHTVEAPQQPQHVKLSHQQAHATSCTDTLYTGAASHCTQRVARVQRVPPARIHQHTQLQQPTCQTHQEQRGTFSQTFQPTPLLTMVVARHQQLPGEILLTDFISEAEEQELVCMCDAPVAPLWRDTDFNGKHRGKAWGVTPNLYKRTVGPVKHPLPPMLQALAQRMRHCIPELQGFTPNEANAIDYRRGLHSLAAHADDRKMSGEIIVTLTLAGRAMMTFERDKVGKHMVRVLLPRRSLQILTKDARYSYTHAIHMEDILDPRRVSITFRHSPVTSK